VTAEPEPTLTPEVEPGQPAPEPRPAPERAEPDAVYSADEEALVTQRLRNLGYI